MTRKIASHYLSSRKGLIRNALVEVADDGEILSLGTAENIDSLCGVEFYSGILCPGWVNAHCHLELSYLRGAIGRGHGLRRLRSRDRPHARRLYPRSASQRPRLPMPPCGRRVSQPWAMWPTTLL